jgi:uncharacterized repeat protein (TIGR03803 family)
MSLSGGTVVKNAIASDLARLLAATAVACILTAFAHAQIQPSAAASYKEKVLHAFTGKSDGFLPTKLMRDAKGNLYGTTAFGGMTGQCGNFQQGCGIVFELSVARKFSVLHTFSFSDGAVPGDLIRDAQGNLYGTTNWGGNTSCQPSGCGVVFKLTSKGDFTVLYSFTGGSDGALPSGLILDAKGNLYGTALDITGSGEVFKLTSSGGLEVLHSFTQFSDGSIPYGGVIQDSQGNLYGTTFQGGDSSCSLGGGGGCGVAYKLDTNGKETVLYTFKGKSDGGLPVTPLVLDKAGNLYGTASLGGYEKGNCDLPFSPKGCGTVFKINTAGAFSVLFAFNSTDGNDPGPLTEDTHGNIYGTTRFGGNSCSGSGSGCGLVYKLTAAGKESILYNFKGQSDGSEPETGVVEDSKGNLYGTTLSGGNLSCQQGQGGGCGTIFQLTP